MQSEPEQSRSTTQPLNFFESRFVELAQDLGLGYPIKSQPYLVVGEGSGEHGSGR